MSQVMRTPKILFVMFLVVSACTAPEGGPATSTPALSTSAPATSSTTGPPPRESTTTAVSPTSSLAGEPMELPQTTLSDRPTSLDEQTGLGVQQISLGDEFAPADSVREVFYDGEHWFAAGFRAGDAAIGEWGPVVFACSLSPQGCEGSVWRSLDGVTWEPPQLLGRGVRVTGLAQSDATTLLVGSITGGNGVPQPAFWTYSESGRWHHLTNPSPGNGEIRDVASDGTGFIAVGYSCEGNDCLGDVEFTATPSAWVSSDGSSWQQVDLGGGTGIARLVVHADERWVAAGDTGNPLQASSWVTFDGMDWTQSAMPAVPNPAYDYRLENSREPTEDCSTVVNALTAGLHGRLVAAGACMPWNAILEHPTAWFSDDGVTWIQISDPDLAFMNPGGVRDLVHTGDEFILVGYLGEESIIAWWTSTNGETWTPYHAEIGGVLASITIGNEQMIAVGNTRYEAIIVALAG